MQHFRWRYDTNKLLKTGGAYFINPATIHAEGRISSVLAEARRTRGNDRRIKRLVKILSEMVESERKQP